MVEILWLLLGLCSLLVAGIPAYYYRKSKRTVITQATLDSFGREM